MILVMEVVNTHALRGEVKALFHADSPELFETVSCLYDNKGTAFVIESFRAHKGALLVKFKGIDDISAAEKLRGRKLYIADEELPPLPEGRYYIADIIGCGVFLADNTPIGAVTNVFPAGGCDVLDIAGADGRQILIPNHHDFVKEIDVAAKRIVITPIEGMI
ncbi:MAG: ribosome maturation factor RimM [Clostridia bacterium]|nr:ribosome maturation factor RimM [Clostridia bacterium]